MDTVTHKTLRHIRYTFLETDTRSLEFFVLLLTISWSIWLGFIGGQAIWWSKVLEVLGHFGGFRVWSFLGFAFSGIGVFSQLVHYPRYRRLAALCKCFYWSLLTYCLLMADPSIYLCWISGLTAVAEFYIVVRRFMMANGVEK